MNKFVLLNDDVYEVIEELQGMYKVVQVGVGFHHRRWVTSNICTEITKEVADCMLACDPQTFDYRSESRYAEGWADPRKIF
jgi:hypothetical protein